MKRHRAPATIVMLALLLLLTLGATSALAADTFSDVPASHPFHADITHLAGLDIIDGYSDGTFRPAATTMRQQVAKIVVNATGKHTAAVDNQTNPTFDDVTPAMGIPYPFDYVEEAAAAGFVKGTGGKFNPAGNITRVQLALIVVRAGGSALAAPPAGYQTGFTDVPDYAKAEVAKAKYNGILAGKTATTFDPYSSATRGHVSRMLSRLVMKMVPAEYSAADGLAGGAAYSQWWTTDADGTGTAPMTTAGSDFYRCKACHGWDGLGTAGSYADRTGKSTGTASRPDVSATDLRAASSKGYQVLFDLIGNSGGRVIDATENTHPDFSAVLTDGQIWNIVKFMREEWIAPASLYDLQITGLPVFTDTSVTPSVVVKPTMTYSNIGALGNEAAGQALYATKCAGCHGATGTTIDMAGASVGEFLRTKPYELWFKVKFGQPGTGMTPGLVTDTGDMQDLYKALTNVTAFPDIP